MFFLFPARLQLTFENPEEMKPLIVHFQKLKMSVETTIDECPCGCESGLDKNHEAHSSSTVSLIKKCHEQKEINDPCLLLGSKC